ncbi:ROK family protein [Sciscionella sediminilitoris]|uniref:ROK family protein n=1 Tax=Sciscionella sediminilitoris TaxID=1445613 RepID=UPI0004DF2173|nr:ROK family protein [Sciscionella sp. SE31]
MRAIGVDIGGTSVRAAVVDEHGSILDTARTATPSGQRSLEDAIVSVVHELTRRHRVGGVGLAIAGFISADRSRVMFAPHLAWRDTDIAERLGGRLGLPVLVEHDTNSAAVAEHRFGAASGSQVAVHIALGTGIGAALVIDGELYRGAHGVAPELGHLRLVPDGRPCPCGKSGCFERYCSGTALSATAVELLAEHPGTSTELRRHASDDARTLTGRQVAAAARDGDPIAQRALAELARWLGEGIALVADIYDPELVVIGGGVSESAPLFLDEAREHYARAQTGSGYRPLARIRTAQLGDDGGMVGAAVLAAESLGTRAAR